MTYIESNKIKVYPAANRLPEYDFGATLNLEQNIVRMSNNIVDHKDYVISGLNISVILGQAAGLNQPAISTTLKINGTFVLNGYIVTITDGVIEPPGMAMGEPLYIGIRLKSLSERVIYNSSGQSLGTIKELNAVDSGSPSIYNGVGIDIGSGTLTDDGHITMGGYSYLIIGTVELIAVNPSDYNVTPISWSPKIDVNTTLIKSDNIDANLGGHKGGKKFEDWFTQDFIIDDGEIQ